MIKLNQLFIEALPVIRKLEAAGYEAYFVGGAVRDFLLNREIHDVDIATSATPLEIKEIFSSTVDVGIEHGTILVLYKGQSFEVTTFRSESNYVDYRRPGTVTFIRSLEEDLKRRDFTINAIALSGDGQLIDPFKGQEALESKLIQTVGNPADRFEEDALRLMRAIRFVSQLGFKVEDNTMQELFHKAPLLQHIAIERITAEMVKLLSGAYNHQALAIALKTNIYKYWPSLYHNQATIQTALTLPIQQLNEVELWVLAVYLHKSKDIKKDLSKWKLPSKKIKLITTMYHFLLWRLENDWTSYSLYSAGFKIACSVEKIFTTIHKLNDTDRRLKKLKLEYEELIIHERSEMQVNGTELAQWLNREPGPWIKNMLEEIEQMILDSRLQNEKMEIRKWVQSCQIPSEKN